VGEGSAGEDGGVSGGGKAGTGTGFAGDFAGKVPLTGQGTVKSRIGRLYKIKKNAMISLLRTEFRRFF
jgi:hypothetical protein